MFDRTLEHSVEIAAPPDIVFGVLTNLEKYDDWCSLYKNARGSSNLGDRFTCDFKEPIYGELIPVKRRVIEFKKNERWGWEDDNRAKWLYRHHSIFDLITSKPGVTLVKNTNTVSGPLALLVGRNSQDNLHFIMEYFCRDLAKAAENLSNNLPLRSEFNTLHSE